MNFGNPERPEIMGQFVGAIEGMREACLALDYPVVSGNVSLYNETSGRGDPADAGHRRRRADRRRARTRSIWRSKRDGNALILIGETRGHLGASLYLREIEGSEDGPPPPVDLAAERRNGDFVRAEIARRAGRRLPRHLGWRAPCRARRDGDGRRNAASRSIRCRAIRRASPGLFGEDQARYLIETADPDAVLAAAAGRAVCRLAPIGTVGGAALTLPGAGAISVSATEGRERGLAAGLYGAAA